MALHPQWLSLDKITRISAVRQREKPARGHGRPSERAGARWEACRLPASLPPNAAEDLAQTPASWSASPLGTLSVERSDVKLLPDAVEPISSVKKRVPISRGAAQVLRME